MSMRPRRFSETLLCLCALTVVACNDSGSAKPDGSGGDGTGNGDFQSAWPGAQDQGRNASGADGELAAPSADSGSQGGGAARAIEEADIIRLDGDRLYALSRISGVSIVDVSQPDALRLVGRYPDTNSADPFEFYVRDGVAMVMFSSWGQYELAADGEGYVWIQTSKLVALDVNDPAHIEKLASFSIPGAISDSRIVGDVLYIVGYEDGYCWGCEENKPRTVVASLDVSDVQNIRKVDQLAYADDDNQWGWNKRSISVTTQRMYVAGPEYGQNGPVGSSIQVIDISDPAGDLVEGDVVQASGQVSSRWQMDEYEGVLRVISQPPQWNTSEPPTVQTFTVVSSNELNPLGSTELVLPRPEQLQSVRFDGLRAYAITFERTDPLFTIDLANPALPVQRGELEIPGFVYHMEPRGDRLIGLGFDQGNPAGSIAVSIFDVSDLSNPTQLDRVNFGGDWASLPEDQDRIHKVFRVLDDHGLILVPHSGWENSSNDPDKGCYWGSYQSGVQLVDFTRDTLTERGAVPSRGEARRALVHEGNLLTVNDQEVASFSIADRNAPVLLDSLAVARNVNRALPLADGIVARVSNDWWGSNRQTIDFVHGDEAEIPSSGVGELDLTEALELDGACENYVYVQDAFSEGTRIMLVYQSQRYDGNSSQTVEGLLVIDASDPATAQVLSNTQWSLGNDWWRGGGYYAHGLPVSAATIARVPGALAMIEVSYEYDERTQVQTQFSRLRVVDIRDPLHPTTKTLGLRETTDYAGYAGLLAAGDSVATSHFEPVPGSDAVRFYLDRIDLSDPSAPALEPSINVPGPVLHYDAALSRALTVDMKRTDLENATWEECAERFATAEFEDDDYETPEGTCHGYQQTLRLLRIESDHVVIEASHEIDESKALRMLAAGDERVFVTLGGGNLYGYYGRPDIAIADCFGPCGYGYGYWGHTADEPEQLMILSGLGDGDLDIGMLDLEAQSDPWYGWWGASHLVATGKRALVASQSELAIIDGSDATHPMLQRTEPLSGYVYGIDLGEDSAVISLGQQGCQVIDL